MEFIRKYKWLLVVVLVVLAGVFSFFYRMYRNDIKALTDFVVSYEKFDKAISDFSIGNTGESESKAGDALAELNTKANFRISSLIRNEKEAMGMARVVANFSGRELDSLEAYKGAIQSNNADVDRLAKEYNDLTSRRKAAYARFRALAGE